MSEFSMELSADQVTLRDWVHGFAEGVLRPAAHSAGGSLTVWVTVTRE